MLDSFFRSVTPFPGKLRMARFFFKKNINTKKDLTFTGKYGIKYCTPNIKETIGFELYVNGIYEEPVINFILSKIPENAVVIDIGANIGAIALPVAIRRKDLQVFCVEAAPIVYKYLIKNIETNKVHNCIPVNKVVSDSDNLQVSFYSPEEKFGKGSMSSVFTTEANIGTTLSIDQLIKEKESKKIDFIKADIEGYEFYAFKGAVNLLSQLDSPDILFEFVDWAENAAINLQAGAAQELLLKYGYSLFKLDSKCRLTPLKEVLRSGSAMIFATKRAG